MNCLSCLVPTVRPNKSRLVVFGIQTMKAKYGNTLKKVSYKGIYRQLKQQPTFTNNRNARMAAMVAILHFLINDFFCAVFMRSR